MSGGSMGYTFCRIEEYAPMLEDPEMIALAKDMAEIYRAAEWYHSGDTCRETYMKKVKEFKETWFESDRTERLKGYVNEIFDAAKEKCLEMIV